ncbi:hypothetical protein HF086_014637 [Spodoptera exigua]|uniref:Uncharacterized protein n=1 Tax=Spodoptera exigua TaxID=7107 RepID=A0A922M5Q7_SPOEX|nr:hypothetical protein HF086_014637 [Spodoptera exigua]
MEYPLMFNPNCLRDFQPLSVNLSQNPITHVTRISKLPIRELNLSNCDIQTLEDGSFVYLEDLAVLDLSNNKISTSAINKKVFAGPLGLIGPVNFKNMQYLSLANNDLHSLAQDLFLFMPDLLHLDLSDNPLAFIDQNVSAGALAGLGDLTILRMNYNPRLTNLDPDFLVSKNEDDEEVWPNLSELYLNNNNLSSIDSAIIDNWKELVAADFSTNPYVCDCKNQWVVDVLVPLLITMSANSSINNMV